MYVYDHGWAIRNFEQFCKNSGYKYVPNFIMSNRDKLFSLGLECQSRNLPFEKLSCIGAVAFMFHEEYLKDYGTFDDRCIELYHQHPEWFDGCEELSK